MNRSEQYVAALCAKTFLGLWSYPNPRGSDGKELCDLLVVCDPDVVIFSVKDIALTNSGNSVVDWKRWCRRAIDDSAKQIAGAERWIDSATKVITNTGEVAISFPPKGRRRLHRVAVAFGSKEQLPIVSEDFGKGFLRFSVGLEDPEDLIEDLKQAIKQVV